MGRYKTTKLVQRCSKQGGGRNTTPLRPGQKYFKQGGGRNTTPLRGREKYKTTELVQKYFKQGGAEILHP